MGTEGRARAWNYIDVAQGFFTPKYYWTIIDAPGHRICQERHWCLSNDTAVLLCAANDGVNAQTRTRFC